MGSDEGTDGLVRVVALPNGDQLVVRPAVAADIDALVALHAALSDEDRYRRFFSFFRPDREFFERVVARADHGGMALVAEVGRPGEAATIVGEADYSRLGNGCGDVAIVVDRAWRGWLAPYLLDALADTAAARGVENLEADVLTANRPMLAVFRHRGCATVASDWAVVRVRIGTATRRPTWFGIPAGSRLLVETPGSRWSLGDRARAMGWTILACPGPAGTNRCPLLEGRRCELSDGADAIVVAPGPAGDPRWHALVDHRAGHPRQFVVADRAGGEHLLDELRPTGEEVAGADDRRRG